MTHSKFLSFRLNYWRLLLQAPGEAEAELAQLNKLGIIDAVLTDDGDALVFGAETVITTLVFLLIL